MESIMTEDFMQIVLKQQQQQKKEVILYMHEIL